jgi:hypothetical protein
VKKIVIYRKQKIKLQRFLTCAATQKSPDAKTSGPTTKKLSLRKAFVGWTIL